MPLRLINVANLEVLNVSDIEYIIEDKSENDYGITSWLEVPGNGTYYVNLQATEFIVDGDHSYVHVIIPYPELTNVAIDYKNVKKLEFRNDILNDNYKVGEDLAQRQLKSADAMIKKEFASNQYFYKSTQNAAISTIQCLVKQFNPNVQNLVVDVDFYENQ